MFTRTITDNAWRMANICYAWPNSNDVSNSRYGKLKPINLADLAGNHLSSMVVVMTAMPASLITDHVITNHMKVPVGMRVTAPTARMFTFGALRRSENSWVCLGTLRVTCLLRGKSKTMTNVNRILNDIDLHMFVTWKNWTHIRFPVGRDRRA